MPYIGKALSIEKVRERIDSIENKRLRIVAMFQLQTACRVSEAVGKYAVRTGDLAFTNYKGNDLALFTIRTAKREGVQRIVALPYTQQWVGELVDAFKKSKGIVFSYGRSSVEHLYKEEFQGFEYFIEKYFLEKDKSVAAHNRGFNSHALRHLRLSELVNSYGFNETELMIYAGWKMKGMASRYVTGQWGIYIDKLLTKTTV